MSETLHPINDRSNSLDADVMDHLNTKQNRHINPKIIDEDGTEHKDPSCSEITGCWRLVEEESAIYTREEICSTCQSYRIQQEVIDCA